MKRVLELMKESPYINGKLYLLYLAAAILGVISYNYFDRELALYFYANLTGVKEQIVEALTRAGESGYYLIGTIVLLLVIRNKPFIKRGLILILASVAASGLITNILKVIFARYRPRMLREDLYGFNWFDFGYAVNSFPSGHATTALSVYVALALLLPKYRYLFLLIGIIIAFTRVMLSLHFLSDILVGGIIGSFISIVLYQYIIVDWKNQQNAPEPK